MKDIDKFKELFRAVNQPFEQGFYDIRNELSDKTLTLIDEYNETIVFRFDEASGKYNGFDVYE
jgi:hypothetical protein